MEVGDPVQGDPYDLGQPYGKPCGIIVSNFARPNWFDANTPASAVTDYLGKVHGAFTMASGGYFSFTKTLPPNWEQEMGEKVNPKLVSHTDRLAR
jgi:hypothetical protein